jgi:hypothetical protein
MLLLKLRSICMSRGEILIGKKPARYVSLRVDFLSTDIGTDIRAPVQY